MYKFSKEYKLCDNTFLTDEKLPAGPLQVTTI